MENTVNKNQNFFAEAGKRAVLFLHAYTGTPNDVRAVARSVERLGYTVYAPLFTGHGTLHPEDILAAGPQDWEKDAKDALAFLEAKGFQEIAVFGLSMGGVFATHLVENHPKVIGGGTFCSPVIPHSEHRISKNFLAYCEQVLRYAKTDEGELTARLAEMAKQNEAQLTAIFDFSGATAKRLPEVTKPMFLAQAGQDQMIDPQTVYQMGAALSQSPHEIHWYPAAKHVITVGSERKALEFDLHQFLTKLPWSVPLNDETNKR